MLLRSPTVETARFENETGWQFKPEGACKGEVCIPLREKPGDTLDAVAMAEAMGLPVAQDASHGLLALGPDAIGGHVLATAAAPDIRLPDLEGREFALSSLKGKKIVVYAWAPY